MHIFISAWYILHRAEGGRGGGERVGSLGELEGTEEVPVVTQSDDLGVSTPTLQ